MLNRPKIVIIDPNTLAVLGLKSILQNVMPIMEVDTYGSFAELEANNPEQYFHYFVAMNIVQENEPFFLAHRRKTIVLSSSASPGNLSPLTSHLSPLNTFHTLCVDVPESQLVRALLALEQHAHGHGQNLPTMPKALQKKVLSDREIEVMALIVQGFINKEIADKLHISLSTVITHRKNIMDKLGLRSVSALTIYAVTHGYVDINTI